jgi:hypothetical protein
MSDNQVLSIGPRAGLVWSSLELRTPAMLRIIAELSETQMRWRPPNNSNSIAWLLWHIAEVEDNWVLDKVYGLPKQYPFGRSVRAAAVEEHPEKRRHCCRTSTAYARRPTID